jgi:hypothetical protein
MRGTLLHSVLKITVMVPLFPLLKCKVLGDLPVTSFISYRISYADVNSILRWRHEQLVMCEYSALSFLYPTQAEIEAQAVERCDQRDK